MALDEPKENDNTIEQDGLTFLVDKDLIVTCGEIKVDFMDSGMRTGFSITSKNPIGGGKSDSGCSSGCSSGGCG